MITVVNYFNKGRWYGCSNGKGSALGDHGFRGSPIDNSEPWDDLCIGSAGFGRPEVGEGSGNGVFCGSGIYSNGSQGKA